MSDEIWFLAHFIFFVNWLLFVCFFSNCHLYTAWTNYFKHFVLKIIMKIHDISRRAWYWSTLKKSFWATHWEFQNDSKKEYLMFGLKYIPFHFWTFVSIFFLKLYISTQGILWARTSRDFLEPVFQAVYSTWQILKRICDSFVLEYVINWNSTQMHEQH